MIILLIAAHSIDVLFSRRSIPIVSIQDFLDPAFPEEKTFPCGEGNATWNTVASSPFAKHVSLDEWSELPQLLDRLRQIPDAAIDALQVKIRPGSYSNTAIKRIYQTRRVGITVCTAVKYDRLTYGERSSFTASRKGIYTKVTFRF